MILPCAVPDRRPRHAVALGVLLLFATAGAARSQTLQHRKPSAAGPPAAAASSGARLALPSAAEGEYRWGESGEVIELYVEDDQLHGYLTRRSDRRDANSAPMTFQFAQAATPDGAVNFATRHIHGDWYAFTGRIVRGTVVSPQQEGYYLLNGTLSMHLGAGEPDDRAVGESAQQDPGDSTIRRQVSLKLTADAHPRR